MVIVSHDREFLDNLCTKIVETERGVATTYKVGGGVDGRGQDWHTASRALCQHVHGFGQYTSP